MSAIPCGIASDSSFGEFEAATAAIDKSRAVAHYTAMVRELEQPMRTQQQMRDDLFAQMRDDESMEDGPCDHSLSVRDYAMDELASTPRVVADWLQEETADMAHRDAVDEYRLQRTDCMDWTAAQCLVMVMRGDQQAVRRAALRLRELFEAANSALATERGAEILREYMAQFDREAA